MEIRDWRLKQIAAIAVMNRLVLVTRKAIDFSGLEVEDWIRQHPISHSFPTLVSSGNLR